MNEFEKYERKRGRRLAYGILLDVVLTVLTIIIAVQHFIQGEPKAGFLSLLLAIGCAAIYFWADRAKLRRWVWVRRGIQ